MLYSGYRKHVAVKQSYTGVALYYSDTEIQEKNIILIWEILSVQGLYLLFFLLYFCTNHADKILRALTKTVWKNGVMYDKIIKQNY